MAQVIIQTPHFMYCLENSIFTLCKYLEQSVTTIKLLQSLSTKFHTEFWTQFYHKFGIGFLRHNMHFLCFYFRLTYTSACECGHMCRPAMHSLKRLLLECGESVVLSGSSALQVVTGEMYSKTDPNSDIDLYCTVSALRNVTHFHKENEYHPHPQPP